MKFETSPVASIWRICRISSTESSGRSLGIVRGRIKFPCYVGSVPTSLASFLEMACSRIEEWEIAQEISPSITQGELADAMEATIRQRSKFSPTYLRMFMVNRIQCNRLQSVSCPASEFEAWKQANG